MRAFQRPITCGAVILGILLAFLANPAAGQGARDELVFSFRSDADLDKWTFVGVDPQRGQPRIEGGRLVFPMGEQSYMYAETDIDAARYNRIDVRMKVNPDMFRFSTAIVQWGADRDFTFERSLEVEVPIDVMTTAEFQTDQSLVWSGDIRFLRLTPMYKLDIMPGTVEIESIRLYRDTTDRAIPAFPFSDSAAAQEFRVFERNPSGTEIDRATVVRNGALYLGDRVGPTTLLRRPVAIDARDAKFVVLDMRYMPTGRRNELEEGTWASFYWSWGGPYEHTRQLRGEIRPVSDWQEVRIDLRSHPDWRGRISEFQIQPTNQQGEVWIRSVSFEGKGGAESGSLRNAVRWLGLDEAQRAIATQYKPLMVYVEKADVEICRRVEEELTADHYFKTLAREYHCVRLDAGDPVVQSFELVYRVPTMIVLTWDNNKRQWIEQERLFGRDLASEAGFVLHRWLGVGGV